MNLFELFVKIGVDDQASGKLKDLGGKLGNGLKTAAKIGTAAVGAAAAGITALTTAAVNNYAEYEQLVGGVETLFKSSSDTVVQYAQNAYKTAGLSANDYMNTVTSFSASLLQSLGGDTDAAAQKADVAITDMADNANKMGTSIEMLQTAYAGFAKQNFTMLDNLKLGYGGTKEEMQRLLDDASKISGIKYDISSFSDITDAIHVMQEEMGIAGATALEAGTTIQGSIGAMKGAWTNLLTGFADSSADIGGLIYNLVTTIVGDGTENNLGVIGNVLPAIETALGGIARLIEGAAPKIIEILPGLVERIVPSLISAATGLVNSLITVFPSLLQTVVDALIQNAPALIVAAVALVEQLATGVLNMLPDILQLGIDLIFVLLDGITKMIDDPAFIQTIVDVVLKMVDILTNPDTITRLLNAAVVLIVALARGLILAVPQLIAKIPEIISNLATAFGDFLQPVIDIGKNIIEGIKKGISDAWDNLVNWFKGLFGDLIGIAKKILGIASPSKVFKQLGKWTAEGFGIGWEDEFDNVARGIEDSLNFGGYDYEVVYEGNGIAGSSANGFTGGGVTVIQNIYSEAKTAADLMQEALYQQERAVYLGV